MVKYDLAELIKNKNDIPLPRIVERLTTGREYRRILRRILKETGRELNLSLIGAYVAAQEEEDQTETAILLLAAFAVLDAQAAAAKVSVAELLTLEAGYLDKSFIAGVKRLTKADVTLLTSPQDTKQLISAIVERNVSLIDDITEQTRGKIQRAVIDARVNNSTVNELKTEIKDILRITGKRGDLIAEDQIAKLSAELVGFRAKQAGMTKYIWRSQGDTRVRPLHVELSGKMQDTSKPFHGDKNRLPRVPIRCRCWAQWVVSALKK